MENTFEQLEPKIIQWGVERDLYHPEHGATADSQYLKFITEIGELADAILKQDREKIKDGIGDAIVCLIAKLKFEDRLDETKDIVIENLNKFSASFDKFSEIELLSMVLETSRKQSATSVVFLVLLEHRFDFKFLECLEFAYNEIKDRKGRMINRTFVKDE